MVTLDVWYDGLSDCTNNCAICGAKPEEMGKRRGNFTPHPDTLEFRSSLLHTRIKIFDWANKGFIYREVREYMARGPENQAKIKAAKKDLNRIYKQPPFYQNAFQVRQGKGTSNNGRTSKVAWAHPEEIAQIVNLLVDFIIDLGHKIDAFASWYELCPIKFENATNDWLDHFHATDMTRNFPSPYLHMLLGQFCQFNRKISSEWWETRISIMEESRRFSIWQRSVLTKWKNKSRSINISQTATYSPKISEIAVLLAW